MSGSRPKLLFVDDSPSQLALYRQQLGAEAEVQTASSYEQAMADLTLNRPDLIVLDMVMPQVDGLEFLDILKASHSFASIPVIMVSAENEPNIVRQAFLKGASDFVRKPYDEEELRLRIHRLLALPRREPSPQEAAALQFVSARSLMVKALADLAGTRDNETGFHLTRIERYTGILALALARRKLYSELLTESFLETIAEISVLHDIGKVGIPDNILRKPGKLTEPEYEVMKTHTTIGGETVRHVQQSFPQYAFLKIAHDVALYHHERWDGTGYPQGLSGHEIPLGARVVALVDVFDALTTKRVYKPAYSVDEALEVMLRLRETHFDPSIFDVFLEEIAEFRAVHNSLGSSAE